MRCTLPVNWTSAALRGAAFFLSGAPAHGWCQYAVGDMPNQQVRSTCRDGDKHGEAGPSKRPSLGDVPARAAAPEHRVKPEEAHAGNRNGRAEAGPSRLGNERRAAGEESRSRQRADRGVDVAQGHSASRRDSGVLLPVSGPSVQYPGSCGTSLHRLC